MLKDRKGRLADCPASKIVDQTGSLAQKGGTGKIWGLEKPTRAALDG